MTTRGFLLGKFMPPHRGHLFLTETARRMVDELTILVCSTPSEPIPGEMRLQWMRDTASHARVLHLDRDMPQAPDDHPDFWAIWREAVRDLHPEPIDRVFAGETYGFRLAQELDAAPVIIDPERTTFSISGTAIRNNPTAHWSDIAPVARPWFQTRLCILGPESVGKSWLAAHLARLFNTRCMPEYGRAYDIYYKQAQGKKGEGWAEQDLLNLAETHAAMRAAMASQAGPLFIEDTDALMTAVWAEHLLGAPSPALEARARKDPADHYILLSPETPWTDDGVRYAGAQKTREWFFNAAKSRLDALGVSYDLVTGSDWIERTTQGVAIAGRLLAEMKIRK